MRDDPTFYALCSCILEDISKYILDNNRKLIIFYSSWWWHIIFWYWQNQIMGGGALTYHAQAKNVQMKNRIFRGKKCSIVVSNALRPAMYAKSRSPIRHPPWSPRLQYWAWYTHNSEFLLFHMKNHQIFFEILILCNVVTCPFGLLLYATLKSIA